MALLFSACTSQQEGKAQQEKPSATAVSSPSAPSAEPSASAESSTSASQKPTASPEEEFPLPVMEGLRVVSTLSTTRGDRSGKQLELTGKVNPAQIAAFYEAEFRKRGLSIRKTQDDAMHGGEILLLGTSETITAGLIVTRDPESSESRAVLSWSEAK